MRPHQIALDALRRCDTVDDLVAAWGDYCELYPEGRQRDRLKAQYDARLRVMRDHEYLARLLRAG